METESQLAIRCPPAKLGAHCCHNRCTYPYSPYPDLFTPIPSHQNHSWAPNAKPEPFDSILSQLASNASPNPLTPLHLSNTLLNTPTPLHLADAFPTRRSFDLSSSLRQVDSWHPHSFLTRRHSTFTLLRQVYSRHLIGLATAVGQSRSRTSLAQCILVCLFSPSIYLYVPLCLIVHYPPVISLSHPQFPVSTHPCLIYLYSISPSTLFSYPVHSLRTIPNCSDQPDHYHTLHLYKYTKYKLL